MKEDAERELSEFAVVTESQRKIPDSLRRLLHDLICDQFDGKPSVASRELHSLLKKVRDQRDFRARPKAMTPWSFLHVVKGRQQISYSQMDAMAQKFGIPIGLMSLFTRVRSDVANRRRTDEALRVLRAVRTTLAALEAHLDASKDQQIDDANAILDHAFFKSFCSLYLDDYHETLI